MFADLSMFNSEKEDHNNRMAEIANSDLEENIKNIKLKEEEERFKNSIRKYLSVAINTINEVFPFSLYKMGKDMDAKFRVIETKIRKGKEEIKEEFEQNKSMLVNLEQKKQQNVLISMQVIIDYSDDVVVNEEKEAYLNGR